MRRVVAPAAVLLAAAATGCGGGDERRPAQRGAAVDPARAVIGGWADAVRRGDPDRATGYFALPVIIEQGRAFRLRRRAELRTFNDGLPCGARLTATARERGYVVATFRLTEREGRTCDAPGAVARVAFRLQRGKIREWRQLPERREPPADAESA